MFFFSTKLITLTHNLGRKQYSSTKLSCGVRKKKCTSKTSDILKRMQIAEAQFTKTFISFI